MKAVIDRDGCIGCGLCADICPEVFRMADDGLAEVHGQVTDGNYDSAKEAEESCPTSVITVE
ncbi:MAG: ferredoxin [Anaerovoracaceae bacterium]